MEDFFKRAFNPHLNLLVPINIWGNTVYFESNRNINSITVSSGILHIHTGKLALWSTPEKVWFWQNARKTSFTFNIYM